MGEPLSLPWLLMSIALAVSAVLAAVLAVILAVVARRAAVARRRHAATRDDLQARLSAASARLDEVEQDRRAVEARVTAAEGRVRAAEQRASDAERRAGEAEKRVAEAMRRADEARLQADEATRPGSAGPATTAVWELEHLRITREWLDVVGPGIGLPQPWDGTIAPVVATELAVIRETIGTPSELTLLGPSAPASPAHAAVAARVSVEMLRTLARSGEEMEVSLSAEALTVVQPVWPDEAPPDLSGLSAVASAGGLSLSVTGAPGRIEARLQLA